MKHATTPGGVTLVRVAPVISFRTGKIRLVGNLKIYGDGMIKRNTWKLLSEPAERVCANCVHRDRDTGGYGRDGLGSITPHCHSCTRYNTISKRHLAEDNIAKHWKWDKETFKGNLVKAERPGKL